MTQPRRPTPSSDHTADEFHTDLLGETPPFGQNGVPPLEEGPDPFDVDSMRLPEDYRAALGLQTVITTVAVRNPHREWWVCAHDSDAYCYPTALIRLKETNESYMVLRPLWGYLQEESCFGYYELYTAINRQGEVFLWPHRLPGPDGKVDAWAQSAYEAIHKARRGWVRVQAIQQGGSGYRVSESLYTIPPEWPALTITQLVQIAFRDKLITSLDHAVITRLQHGV